MKLYEKVVCVKINHFVKTSKMRDSKFTIGKTYKLESFGDGDYSDFYIIDDNDCKIYYAYFGGMFASIEEWRELQMDKIFK